MTLFGLSLAQLGLIFGAAGGAIVVLYILKLRRRRVLVPFSRLWERVLKQKESTSLFRRLRRLLSLLLQLFLLLLFTAALGDPRLSSEVLEGRHIILLIDTSASMQATDTADGRPRLAQALDEARRIVRGMSGADMLMVVRMDAQVTPLSAFESDEKALLKVFSGVRATDTRADIERALMFCGDALRGRDNPQLILVSDGAFDKEVLERVRIHPPKQPRGAEGSELGAIDLSGLTVRYLPLGKSSSNVGIVAFNARRYVRNKLSFEIFLEVVNYRAKAAEVNLQLYSDEQLIDVQRLNLKAGETARYSCDPDQRQQKKSAWCDIAANGEMLEARLSAVAADAALDAFPLDDRAYALLPRRKKQKVLLVTKGNMYLEGALLLDSNLEVRKLLPSRYTQSAARPVDVVIFDGHFPTDRPAKHTLVLNPPAEGGPFKVTGRLKGPMITDQSRTHPVMRFVTLKDTNIRSAASFASRPDVQVLAASFKQPVLVAKVDQGIKSVAFGFDVKQSDLPLRIAFPILILNCLDWFAGETEGLVTSYRTGTTWSVPLDPAPGAGSTVSVEAPDGTRFQAPVAAGGRALIYGVRTGVYALHLGGDQPTRLAANLADPAESRIEPRPELRLQGQRLERPSGFGVALRREIWIYFLLCAVALVLIEWLTYNRRMTV